MITYHDKRCRRDSSRIVRYFESRTSHRVKRRVTLPSISGGPRCVNAHIGALEAPLQPHQRRRPARGRPRISTRQVSCTLEVLYLHAGHHTRRVSAT
jgi:hypothetical protein